MSRSRRSSGTYKAGVAKSYGTPTVHPPVPQAIDDYTGFKVPLHSLKRDWQNLLTMGPDKRNPQDYLRGVRDQQALPYSRPEVADSFVAGPIIWQDGSFMSVQGTSGALLLTQGVDPADTL